MTNEEIQKLMDYILNQQAKIAESYAQMAKSQAQIDEKHIKISNLIEFIAEQQAKADVEIAEMRASTLDLARSIGTVAIQADADRQIINNRMNMFEAQAEKDRAETRNQMNTFEAQAEKDRSEMREGFTELRNIVAGLANITGSNIRKVNDLDERVVNLEKKK